MLRSMKRTDERELLSRFGSQYGVVSRAELRRLGVDRQRERARVARGDWERVGRRVVRLRGAPISGEQALMAACLEPGRRELHLTSRRHGYGTCCLCRAGIR